MGDLLLVIRRQVVGKVVVKGKKVVIEEEGDVEDLRAAAGNLRAENLLAGSLVAEGPVAEDLPVRMIERKVLFVV